MSILFRILFYTTMYGIMSGITYNIHNYDLFKIDVNSNEEISVLTGIFWFIGLPVMLGMLLLKFIIWFFKKLLGKMRNEK